MTAGLDNLYKHQVGINNLLKWQKLNATLWSLDFFFPSYGIIKHQTVTKMWKCM